MTTRTPTAGISIPDISQLTQPTQWHSLKCELVTPMYGGGVRSTVVDKNMPIRVTGIRGQLRFWWRLLAKQKWYPSLLNEDIRKKEFALWGGMNSGDDDGKASLVMLRVRDVKKITVEPWAEYELNKKNKEVLKPKKDWANVPYALFPAQGRTEQNPNEEPHSLLREGCCWTLEFAFAVQISEQQKNEVWESFRWWASFGGVGSRTRRGLGAVKVDLHEKLSVVTTNELEQIGLKFRTVPSNSPYKAWESSVSKLQKFRQIGAGRNDFSSRSHWSEPDAIRQITGQALVTHTKSHAERKTTGNIFPRAGFGLPIIFKFKDGGDNRRNDPKTTTLTAKYNYKGKWIDFERLASPLILRPYLDKNEKWNALALCLPDKLVNDSDFSLKLDESDVKYWDKSQANDIKPLNINGEILEPLDAFLAYFSNN